MQCPEAVEVLRGKTYIWVSVLRFAVFISKVSVIGFYSLPAAISRIAFARGQESQHHG